MAVTAGVDLPLLLYALPGIKRLEDLSYDFIAAVRRKLPGIEHYCKQHPKECRWSRASSR